MTAVGSGAVGRGGALGRSGVDGWRNALGVCDVLDGSCGVVAAKGIEHAVGADDVSAAPIDSVLIPAPRVHEGFDEEAEGVAFIELELPEQFAERFALAAALQQVFEAVADLVAEETLHGGEVDEVADRARAFGVQRAATFDGAAADGAEIGAGTTSERERGRPRSSRRFQ